MNKQDSIESFEYAFISDHSDDLTKALNFFQMNGFVIINKVFDQTEVDQFLSQFEEISQKRKSNKLDPFSPLLTAHHRCPHLRKRILSERMLWCVKNLLGGPVDMLESQVMFKPPGTPGTKPHQDDFFVRSHPSNSILTAWMALERATQENGGLYVYPSSHLNGKLKVRRHWHKLISYLPQILSANLNRFFRSESEYDNSARVGEFYQTIIPENYERHFATIPPGSIIFMHGDLVHGSSENNTETMFRRSITNLFIIKGVKFHKGLAAGRKVYSIEQ